MYPHRIRLRGPWECQPLAWHPAERARELPAARRVTMPCRWADGGLAEFRGRVRFVRRFGYPGRIDEFERVWLTLDGVEGSFTLWLNDVALGDAWATDVTRLLKARNELRVEIEGDERAGLWGEVALEVRCSAFLRDVRLESSAGPNGTELHARGEVVGESLGPLELYLVRDRRTVAYAAASATPDGWPFHLVATDFDAEFSSTERHSVKLDLVHGASVWYTWEQPHGASSTSELSE